MYKAAVTTGTSADFVLSVIFKESQSHVLGSCPRGDLLRNLRHNHIRIAIAEEEKECAENGSRRQIVIIAINEGTRIGILLTVRFESSVQQSRMKKLILKKEVFTNRA